MKLYYTVSSYQDTPQQNIGLSLGGYRSSTFVRNDEMNNLFGDISLMSLKQNKSQFIAIMMKNELDVVAGNVRLFFSFPMPTQCIYQLAAVIPTKDSDGNDVMERTETIYSKPMYGTFVSPTEQSPAIIGDMQPGQQVGLWICRSLDLDAAMEEYNDVAEIDPAFTLGKRYKKKVQNTEENVNLNIFWD